MRTMTILIALTLLTTGLAGCTGDPDGSGDEFDAETLQGMIESGLQDFMNNTTVEITTNYYTNETSTTTNNVNGTVDGIAELNGTNNGWSLHTMAGNAPPYEPQLYSIDDYGVAILYNPQVIQNTDAGLQADGAEICISIGSEMESIAVNYFTENNMDFTSVPVADAAETHAKLIDGSCDATVGDYLAMDDKQDQLANDGHWFDLTTIVGGDGYSGLNQLELTIQQDSGVGIVLEGVYIQAKVVGVCVANCSESDEDIVLTYTDHAWSRNLQGGEYSWSSWASYTSVHSECEYNLTTEIQWSPISYLMFPGLVCEHTIRTEIHIQIGQNIDDWRENDWVFTWTDWTYVLHWATAPVTVHSE